MSEDASRSRGGPLSRVAGLAVHVLTASGAVWGLFAIAAIAEGRIKAALYWMALAVVIDGVDGFVARLARVEEVLPGIDGTLLDNLIDYFNYAVVPAFLLLRAVPLPSGTARAAAAAICLAAAFQLTRVGAKTTDRFVGFPSYWNVVVLYLLLLRPPGRVALAVVALLCVLSFVPFPWVYPTRTREWRRTTLVLTGVWAAVVLVLLGRFPEAPRSLTLASLAYASYYLALSLWLQRRG